MSGLYFLSKLVERVVARQLTSHINNNKLDNPHQPAYKPGHSTETALLTIKNEVHLSLARGEPTALVLLDLSAAFDTIDHNILLGYLKSWFGLGGTALRWFASYLRNRCQAIKIGSTLSELSNLIYGVPQGSVLGRLLFSLYTTPLSKIIRLHPHIKFHFYADDTQLYIHLSHKNASSALAKLNACLRDVQEWMPLSKLKLNPEFIVFGSKAQHQKISSHFPVSILGSLLHPVDSVRNLGVWFDADFSFSEHIKRTCKACFLQMRDLRRIRKLNACLRDVQEWMSLSKLKLNPEFIVFGSKAQRQKISSHFPVSILGSLLHPVDSVRNLGVWFDADFSFSEHIKRTCKACFLQMRDLRRIRKLNACLRDVQEWMSLSKLKLNPEFIVFGSKAQRQKISSHFPVSILGSLLHPVDSVRNLGVWFDADFSFSEHIKRTCKACFLQMRDLRRIRKYLTSEVAVLAANALVSSRLDYCNSLFRGLSGFNQHKLQSIQNTLARIVTNHRKYAHVTPILQKLHWLPVKYRCIFKTATLVYKFLHSGSPSYFEPFLSFSSCPYSTRHSHPDRQYSSSFPFIIL